MNDFDINGFWKHVALQDPQQLSAYFNPDATILWEATNESFTVASYLRANCEYPGRWQGTVIEVKACPDTLMSITKIDELEMKLSFYAVSFFTIKDGLITHLREYWCDITEAPQWRQNLRIGKAIR
ncbi:nuclear transport factor 2 family protein [Erysipelothrix sp. HDW6C]|uniref:nuclear transport factor 2 family protein n=1 Tax=Erysipelothrix sp. HDW6C TaxID=2714930 RepID=UPI00140C0048|nr:nuclear transport factor 2 family protein [Erysipelothrix sp. HDW6C]QIK69500.1 nuclear transport factor 2 family protein [Erysipelothrix sp. HDW6C]